MTKAELKEKLEELSDELSDIQVEVEDIPDTSIKDIDVAINGQLYPSKKGLDREIGDLIDELNELSEAEIKD